MKTTASTSLIFATHLALMGPAYGSQNALNDTGMITCYVNGKLTSKCAGTGQDAEFGSDATKPRNSNGQAGFSFVKLDEGGKHLPSTSTSWACILDKNTGLVWENKTVDGGPHDGSKYYSMEPSGSKGGGLSALDLVANANTAYFCGQALWHVPNRTELFSIVNYGRYDYQSSVVDAAYFPNNYAATYWTSSTFSQYTNVYWSIAFDDGTAGSLTGESGSQHVRIVSGRIADSKNRLEANGDEVLDHQTGLIWKRCSEGKMWDNNHCTGKALRFKWLQALDHANAVAAETGKAWRLPNAKELESIVNLKRIKPSIDQSIFPQTPNLSYLTSTGLGTPNPGTKLPIPVAGANMVVISFQKGYSFMRDTISSDFPSALRLVRTP